MMILPSWVKYLEIVVYCLHTYQLVFGVEMTSSMLDLLVDSYQIVKQIDVR